MNDRLIKERTEEFEVLDSNNPYHVAVPTNINVTYVLDYTGDGLEVRIQKAIVKFMNRVGDDEYEPEERDYTLTKDNKLYVIKQIVRDFYGAKHGAT